MLRGLRAENQAVFFASSRPLLRYHRPTRLSARLAHVWPSPCKPNIQAPKAGKSDDIEAIARYTESAIYSLHRALLHVAYYEVTDKAIKRQRERKNGLTLDHTPLELEGRPLGRRAGTQPATHPLQLFTPYSWPASERLAVGRRYVIRYIVDAATAAELVAHFGLFKNLFCQYRSTERPEAPPYQVLKLVNALVERLAKFDVKPDADIILYGLDLAARAQSMGALRRYMDLAASASDAQTQRLIDFDAIFEALETLASAKGPSPWENQRRKAEIATLLIGTANFGKRQTQEPRRASLLSLLGRDAEWTSHRFFKLLGFVGGQNAVYRAWTSFQTVCGQSPPAEFAIRIILALVREGDLERAWEVYYAANVDPQKLPQTVWWSLFNRPESLRQWHAGMTEPLMSKYLCSIQKIEEKLGIEWSGGEDGHHIVLDDIHVDAGPKDLEDRGDVESMIIDRP